MPVDEPPADDTAPPPHRPEGREPGVEGAGRWQLRRSVRDRKLKGVAGGVAAAADVDVTLIRLLFAVAALSGWGIVAYIVLAIVLQDETAEDPARPLLRDQRRMLRIGLGVAAVIAVGRIFDGWFFTGGDIGLPFLLIAVGAAVLWARRDQRPPEPLGSPPAASAAPAGPDGVPPPWPVTAPAPPLGAGIDWRSTGHDLLRLAAAFVAVGAFLALLGVTFLVVVGAVPMRVPFLPATLGALGLLGLVVAVIRRGRPSALFVSGGVLLVAAALAVGLASFPGGAGTRVVVIGPGTPLSDRYEQSAGRLVLDLRTLTLEPGTPRRVVARVGSGQLRVIVPPAITTDVEASAGAGSISVFGRHQSGPGVDLNGSHAGTEGAGRLALDLDVGVGQITVELPPAPTFKTSCLVPPQPKGDGSDPVQCPHPIELEGRPMSCSVPLADMAGNRAPGLALCQPAGTDPASRGMFAATCTVPADSDTATCGPLSQDARHQMASSGFTDPEPSPATTAPPDPGRAPLTCGPPDAAGVRTCTTTPAASPTTTAPASYRCTEDPATRQLSCVPA